MWKYIITWVLQYYIPTNCPDAAKTDVYGRQAQPYGMTCAVYHVKQMNDTLRKEFTSRKDVDFFIAGAIDKPCNTMMCEKVMILKIDSVKIK